MSGSWPQKLGKTRSFKRKPNRVCLERVEEAVLHLGARERSVFWWKAAFIMRLPSQSLGAGVPWRGTTSWSCCLPGESEARGEKADCGEWHSQADTWEVLSLVPKTCAGTFATPRVEPPVPWWGCWEVSRWMRYKNGKQEMSWARKYGGSPSPAGPFQARERSCFP